eukprot:9304014-Alexandrium_andersonii.AAC.1
MLSSSPCLLGRSPEQLLLAFGWLRFPLRPTPRPGDTGAFVGTAPSLQGGFGRRLLGRAAW